MIVVRVVGNGVDVARLAQRAAKMQRRFQFVGRTTAGTTELHITDDRSNVLFSVDRNRGVAVSTWQSDGISRYAGLDLETYFLICGLLGLTQWRALETNPLLRSEDFIHNAPRQCLFSNLPYKQDYALLFERPRVCGGCLDFFRCLGVEPEVEALGQVLDFVGSPETARGGSRERPSSIRTVG